MQATTGDIEEATMEDIETHLHKVEDRLAQVAAEVPAELRRHIERSRAEVMFVLAALADR